MYLARHHQSLNSSRDWVAFTNHVSASLRQSILAMLKSP